MEKDTKRKIMNKQNITIEKLSAPYDEGVWIIYDGDCPMCKTSTHIYRLKEQFGTLHLINARDLDENPELLTQINDRELDLDVGMVILQNNEFFHGADALWFMAMHGDQSYFFSKICSFFFKSKVVTSLVYPFLRFGRNFLLFIRAKKQIKNLKN